MAWTSDTLVAKVRRKARIPDGDSALSDVELLQIGDEVTRTDVLALLQSTNGEWYVSQYTTPLVSGQKSYRIPERLQAGSVRKVTLVQSSGREIDLPELTLDYASEGYWPSTGRPTGFVFEDNSIVFRTTPTNTGESLRIRYRRQPSTLILTASANAVSLASGTGQSVNATAPLTAPFNTSGVDADVVQAKPPFDVLMTGAGAGAASVFTFDDAAQSAADVAAGDYLCAAGETPVPQVPPVCHDLLVYGMASTAADELGLGDADRLRDRFERAKAAARRQLMDRNESSSRKVFNRFSPLRVRRRWGHGGLL